MENFERGTRVIVRLWDELAAGVRAVCAAAWRLRPVLRAYVRLISGHRLG